MTIYMYIYIIVHVYTTRLFKYKFHRFGTKRVFDCCYPGTISRLIHRHYYNSYQGPGCLNAPATIEKNLPTIVLPK